MANAQETGNLVMDVRRYGKSGELVSLCAWLSKWGNATLASGCNSWLY